MTTLVRTKRRTIIGFFIVVAAISSILLLTVTGDIVPLNRLGHMSQTSSRSSWLSPGAYAVFSGSEEMIPDVPCIECPDHGISTSNFSLTVVILDHNNTHYKVLWIIGGTIHDQNAVGTHRITWFRLLDPVNPFPWGQGLPSNRTYQADVRINNRTISTVVYEFRDDQSGIQRRIYSSVDADFPVGFSYAYASHDIYVIDLRLSQTNIPGLS